MVDFVDHLFGDLDGIGSFPFETVIVTAGETGGQD